MQLPLAYLDAGSGAMLLQLVVGGAAGVAAFVRYRWRRMTARGDDSRPMDAPVETHAVSDPEA